jgi:hypothetical protein
MNTRKQESNRKYRSSPEVRERQRLYNARNQQLKKEKREATQEWKDRQEVLKRVREIEEIIRESKIAYEKRIAKTQSV